MTLIAAVERAAAQVRAGASEDQACLAAVKQLEGEAPDLSVCLDWEAPRQRGARVPHRRPKKPRDHRAGDRDPTL